ncbi:Uncharacterized protein Fot_13873 [Forsythia ovata]|uniref:Uncharacterized protein n=1 Tax=Forsythia ovata TaxID=205694 RepID=A0ABD1W880_9LAMI
MEIAKSYMEGMAYVWLYCFNINHPSTDCELFSIELCKRFSNCNEEVEKNLEKDFEIKSDNITLKDEEDAIKEEEVEAPIFIQLSTMSVIASPSTPLSITATDTSFSATLLFLIGDISQSRTSFALLTHL